MCFVEEIERESRRLKHINLQKKEDKKDKNFK